MESRSKPALLTPALLIGAMIRPDCATRKAGAPPPSASLVPRFIDTMTFVASATASSSRSDNDAMSLTSWRRSDKEIDAVPPPPFGLMRVAGDLCVARRRRCPCIAFSLLLDFASQAPSANVTISMKRDTARTLQYVCGGLGYPLAGHAPYQAGPSAASRRPGVRNAG